MVQLAVLVLLLERWIWQRKRRASKTGAQTIDAMLSNNRVYLVAMDSPNAMFHHPVACFSGRDMQFV